MKKSILRTNLLIAVVIILGFGVIEGSTSLAFRRLFAQDVEYVSKLTSENMYMGIKELMGLPINVSLSMARNNFLRDYMLQETEGVQSPDRIAVLKSYLAKYQDKNGFDSAFLVSTKTGNYYHYKNGIDRVMSPENEEDLWYYEFLNSQDEYALNVDNDQATDNSITIFVNCKLRDESGAVLGVIGVGMETPYIQSLLGENEKQYQIAAYLVDGAGNVQLSSTLTEVEQVNLFAQSDKEALKNQILSSKATVQNRWYETAQGSGYFVTRYIPYLNWYLVVEKSTDALHRKIAGQQQLSAVLTLAVLAGVLAVTTAILKKNNQKITNLAEQDQLTCFRNRTSYERDIERYQGKLAQYQRFGIGIFDLNDLKEVNDRHGHQEGDIYLQAFSNILSRAFDSSPIYRIGGDEFCVILLDLDEADILRRWAAMQCALEAYSATKEYPTTAAFGYAFYEKDTINTVQLIFSVADRNMYEEKNRYKLQLKEESDPQ